MTEIVVVGGGGHAKAVIELMLAIGGYSIVGMTDKDHARSQSSFLGVETLGDDRVLKRLLDRGIRHAAVGVGSIRDNHPRQRIYEQLKSMGFQLPALVHPSAWVSPSASLREGVHVMAKVLVQANVQIGENVILNTGSIVEHDCRIGSHVHVSSGACLAGEVRVGELAFIGVGARVIQTVRIGEAAVVGAGAVVLNDVEPRAVMVGVPARALPYVA